MGSIDLRRGFLARLARDVRGNTIAIMAAAMIPLSGLIGGGVDMSRLYLAKTRLQQACDAGALAGRKAMAAGAWTTGNGNGSTNDKAEAMFSANFKSGQYGSGQLIKAYSEEDGTVNGTAVAIVPMTIMKVFGMKQRTVRVTCTAKMEIPNTDVMFVLDVTGSMMCASGVAMCGSYAPNGTAKMDGLKSAVKCFYEALLRVNTTEVCGNDPAATTSTTTAQIRLGFVPYSVNVNVGKLLPNSYMADSWTYQSRVATTGTVYAWSLGSAETPNWTSVTATPDAHSSANRYNSFSTVSGSNSTTYTMADGSSRIKKYTSATNSTQCNNLNTYGSNNQLVGIQETTGNWGSASYTASDNSPPVYPASIQNQTATRTRTNSVTLGFKYVWTSNACYLQSASAKTGGGQDDYVQTQSGTSSKPISWTSYANAITGWTYQPISQNVSALKAGNATWNGSVSLPIGATNGPSVKLSGSNSTTTIQYPAASTVTWDGCIEERQTYQNTNGSPELDWATIPASAFDMNLNMLPSDAIANSKWGPMLPNATWSRYDLTGCSTGSRTTNAISTTCNLNHNVSYSCPAAAKKLTVFNSASPLESYIGTLSPGGATYHDIGMIWGARLMSPTGIFGGENDFTPAGNPIQRHMIFMTDGDTNTSATDYSAYGIGWYNRLQTSYNASDTQMDNMTNARLVALCQQVKNMNITLWVISYGGGVNEATETRLSACATPGHYYSATDGAALIDRFRKIASEISELRLTS